ncbi:MAG: hypothetical protein ACR2P8_05175 [Myxococcota bacterium]
MAELATRVIELTPEGLNDFPGTYDEYLERCGDDHLDAQVVLRRARESKREARAARKERPARSVGSPKRRRKQLEARLEALTEEIQRAETRVAELNERFCAADFFSTTPGDERAALQAEHQQLSETVRERMSEWETLEEELGTLPAG